MQHIHHLWRIYDPETDAPLTTALINYFPTFVMRDPDMREQCRASLKTHPWHYGLTDEERAANSETGQRAAEFIVGASQYLEDPAAYCSDNECVARLVLWEPCSDRAADLRQIRRSTRYSRRRTPSRSARPSCATSRWSRPRPTRLRGSLTGWRRKCGVSG